MAVPTSVSPANSVTVLPAGHPSPEATAPPPGTADGRSRLSAPTAGEAGGGCNAWLGLPDGGLVGVVDGGGEVDRLARLDRGVVGRRADGGHRRGVGDGERRRRGDRCVDAVVAGEGQGEGAVVGAGDGGCQRARVGEGAGGAGVD